MGEVGPLLAGWTPPPAPSRAVLANSEVRLEPLAPARHADALFAAAAEPALWTYMGYGPFADSAEFAAWLAGCTASSDPLFYAIVRERDGLAAGMASYLRIAPAHGVIEIGHIWLAPDLQRTRAATEAIFLLLRHAFDELGYRRVEWKCDALNAASRRAALRFGFRYEATFAQHMVIKGRNRDTAWFALLDRDWPLAREAFERWLAPESFDAAGRQRAALADVRAALGESAA